LKLLQRSETFFELIVQNDQNAQDDLMMTKQTKTMRHNTARLHRQMTEQLQVDSAAMTKVMQNGAQEVEISKHFAHLRLHSPKDETRRPKWS
jgi:hypothetical protein